MVLEQSTGVGSARAYAPTLVALHAHVNVKRIPALQHRGLRLLRTLAATRGCARATTSSTLLLAAAIIPQGPGGANAFGEVASYRISGGAAEGNGSGVYGSALTQALAGLGLMNMDETVLVIVLVLVGTLLVGAFFVLDIGVRPHWRR